MMKTLILSFLLFVTASVASADCYANYKAKKDDPLRLQYGVAQIQSDCAVEAAAAELVPRLAVDGWELLEVLGTFDESGLDERRERAGQFYLRY